MAVGRKSANIIKNGSEVARYMLFTSAGAPSGTTVYEFPIIKSCELVDETAYTEEVDENGNVYEQEDKTTRTFKAVGMQKSADDYQLMNTTLDGTHQVIVKEMTTTPNADSKLTYLVMFTKPKKSVTIKSPGVDLDLNFSVVANTSQIAINLASFNTTAFSTTLTGNATIAAGKGYTTIDV